MEGIFGGADPGGGDDEGGGDGGGDTPYDSASGGTGGPLVELGENADDPDCDGDDRSGSPSRMSLAGSSSKAEKYRVASAGSVDGVNHQGRDADSDVGVRSLVSPRFRSNESIGLPGLGLNGGNGNGTTVVTAGGMLNSGLSGSVTGMGTKLASLPPSPFVRRPASKSTSFSSHVRLTGSGATNAAGGGGGKKPLVLFTYMDAQEHLPYADDSTAVTPKSELNGGIVVDTPTRMAFARKLSYNSHTGKLVDNSYNSHTDLRYPPGQGGGMCSASGSTKEGILTKRMASLFNEREAADRGRNNNHQHHQHQQHHRMPSPNSILLDPITGEPTSSLTGAPVGGSNGLYGGAGNNRDFPSSITDAGGRDSISGNFINTNGKDSVDMQVSTSTSVPRA